MNKPINNKKILIICPFPQGRAAGQRLKYEQYFNDWMTKGYEIEISSFMDEEMWEIVYKDGYYLKKIYGTLRGHFRRIRDLFRISNYDLIYIFMWVTPFGSSLFERLFRLLANKIIFDLEDNILIKEPSHLNLKFPNSIISLFKSTNKTKYLIRHSNFVITSSPFLNEICIKINKYKLSMYISSSVDTERFVPTIDIKANKPIIIGWTGTFSSKVYLDQLSEIFQELSRRVDFRLRIIGNFNYSIPGVNLEVINWTKESEIKDLQKIDIGVYPLPKDGWVLGKSGLKAIQYMAIGIPVVATNIGINPMLIKNYVNGILVNNNEEWIQALEKLIYDSELRKKLGAAARTEATNKYSTKKISVEYEYVLNKVMEN